MEKFLILTPILLIHFLILSNLKFTAWPEIFSYPYLLQNGFYLYKDFIMPYPPGLIVILNSIFSVFGFSVEALKVFTLIWIFLTDFVILLILENFGLRKIYLFFILLVYVLLQPFLDGNMLWFDFATALPTLVGFFFIHKWLIDKKNKWLLWIGVFLGLAILIKQIAVLYLIGFIIFFWLQKKDYLGLRNIILGVLAIWLPFIFYLTISDSLLDFLKWNLIFPVTEWSKFPGYVAMGVTRAERLVLILLGLPLMFLLLIKNFHQKKLIQLTGLFLLLALLAVYPRFSYFHLQPTLAFFIIFIAAILINLKNNFQWKFVVIILGIVLSIVLISSKSKLGNETIFGPEKEQVNLINNYSKKDERIFLLGLPSGLYIFSNRLPPKNWSDNFGWYLEIPGIQDWVIDGFRKTPPIAIFWKIPQEGNWYDLGVYQPKKITEYIRQNYHKKLQQDNIEVWIKNEE